MFDNGSKYGTIIIDENEDRDFVKIDPNKKYQINRTRI